MANSSPWCATSCTDIHFEVTDISPYGNAIVDVLEFSCLTGGLQSGELSGIEVLPIIGVAFRIGGQGWAKLVQSSPDGECYWRAYALSEGNPLTIRFSIFDPFTQAIDPCTVLVNILSRPNGIGLVPEEDPTGYHRQTVYVHDAIGCFIKGPAEDLVGMGGYACYMNAVESSDVYPGAQPAEIMPPGVGFCPGSVTPRWEIIQLCCRQDRCDIFPG